MKSLESVSEQLEFSCTDSTNELWPNVER